MGDHDGATWWNRSTVAVKEWWTRSGWKTIATMALLLAIAFGVAASAQRVILAVQRCTRCRPIEVSANVEFGAMGNGEGVTWNRSTAAVKKWWARSGWKTIATLALPLAIVFGAIAGIQRVELQDHHLHIDPTGPNWAEIVTAISTFLLAVGAFLALLAILEARRARHAETITEAARRWDDQALRHLRAKVQAFVADAGEVGLRDEMLRLRSVNSTEYYELLAVPDYFEDLAILMRYRAVTFRMVDDALGITAANYWSLWSPFVMQLRALLDDDRAYENFEELGVRIRKVHSYSQARNLASTR